MRQLIQDRRGTAALEFAVVAMVLCVGLLAMVELGRFFWMRSMLQFLVEETGREVLVQRSPNPADIEATLRQRAGAFDPARLQVAALTETVNDVTFVQMDARYQFDFIVSPFPTNTITLTGRTRVPASP